MASRIWAVANVLMLVAFVVSVIVQFNDPDPLAWVLVYGAAAVVCGAEIVRRTPWWAPAAVAIGAIAWAATIAPRVIGKVPFGSMFEEFEMQNVGIEESREMYGLFLIAMWMVAVFVATLRRTGQRADALR